MGLPIVLGSKCVASRNVSAAQPIEVFDDDDDDDDDDSDYGEGAGTGETTHVRNTTTSNGSRSILYPSSLISSFSSSSSCDDDSDDSKNTATVITATSLDQELLAIVTIYYYNMIRRRHDIDGDTIENHQHDDNEKEEIAYCVAELHIQISSTSTTTQSQQQQQPVASIAGRDSIHRIQLVSSHDTDNHSNSRNASQGGGCSKSRCHRSIQSKALFSSDRRYLTCLIAHPSSSSSSSSSYEHHQQPPQASTIVMFQLRKPNKQDRSTTGNYNTYAKQLSPPPPLPSYVIPSKPTSTTTTTVLIPVATNPRIIPIHNGSVLCNAVTTPATTAMTTNATTTLSSSSSSSLWIGCCDGRLYVTTYRRPYQTTRVSYDRDNSSTNDAATPRSSAAVQSSSDSSSADMMIISMDYCCLNHSLPPSDSNRSLGRLTLIFDNGNVSIYNTSVSSTNHNQQPLKSLSSSTPGVGGNDAAVTLRHNMDEESESESHNNDNHTHRYDPRKELSDNHRFHKHSSTTATSSQPDVTTVALHRIQHDFQKSIQSSTTAFQCTKWISSSYLILLEEPTTDNSESSIHVYGIYDNNNANNNNSIHMHPLSTMTMTKSLLEEYAGDVSCSTVITTEKEIEIGNQRQENVVHQGDERWRRRRLKHPVVSLEYDQYSDCIAVTSFLMVGENNQQNRASKTRTQQLYPFSCLWNWRVNVLGYTVCNTALSRQVESMTFSSLYFELDDIKRRRLVRVMAIFNRKRRTTRVCKESYDLAVLSPPRDHINYTLPQLRESNSLLLSANSVSYPITARTSVNIENYEIDWMESGIPKTYLSTYCAPQLAAIGRLHGRSIAIASSRGFCVLDRGSDVASSMCVSPRWRLFANETHEREFRVVAFIWWETSTETPSSKTDNSKCFDDILVAVVEVLDSRDDNGFFLSCWSVRDIELSAQLLSSAPSSKSPRNVKLTKSHWGIKLPGDFIPSGVDCLACPVSFEEHASPSMDRVATVLVTDGTIATNYLVYQLRFACSDLKDSKRKALHTISGRCTACGNIGSPAELFVASASFACDMHGYDEFTVVGVIRTHNSGVDAILVNSSSIIGIGQIVQPSTSLSTISRYWLADTVCGLTVDNKRCHANSFEWMIQLFGGRFVSWSVPFSFEVEQTDTYAQPLKACNTARFVHPKSRVLGIVSFAGTTANWMQQSARGVQSDFLGGIVPQSSFGYVVGINQNYKKIATSVGAGTNVASLRANFQQHVIARPGEFRLYPPTYLPSMYVRVVGLLYETDSLLETSFSLERYVKKKMTTIQQQDMAVLTLQLIVLRLVEKLAQTSHDHNSDRQIKSRLYEGLVNLVATIRNNTTPLQYAIFFLSLGRQMEASCLHVLFPLPGTIDDLYNCAAAYGSISTSVSTLPISANKESTLLKCQDLFHVCVDRLDRAFKNPLWCDFDLNMDEFQSVGEIFRYAIKVGSKRSNDNKIRNEDSDSDDDIPVRNFSVMCGLSKVFGPNTSFKTVVSRKTNDETPLLVHGIADDKLNKLKSYGVKHIRKLALWQDHSCTNTFTNVPQIAARFVVSSIFGGDSMDCRIGWIKVALLSTAVMCDMSSEYYHCTRDTLSKHIEAVNVRRFVSLAPLDIRRTGPTKALDYFFRSFNDDIDPDTASRMFDFIVVLLGCDVLTFPADLPGLVLVAIVAAHNAGRISDILSPESDDTLSTSYFERCTQQQAVL